MLKAVSHRITTGFKLLKNTLLLFISITAFAKLLPNRTGRYKGEHCLIGFGNLLSCARPLIRGVVGIKCVMCVSGRGRLVMPWSW